MDRNQFWKLNNTKLLCLAGFSAIVGFVLGYNIWSRDGKAYILLLAPMFMFAFMFLGYWVRGTILFDTMKDFIEDNSEKSLLSLFDNGYTAELNNIIFDFTTERLNGTISGIPVVVSFTQRGRFIGKTYISFNFSILPKNDFEQKQDHSISFDMNELNESEKDIKSEVINYVTRIKEATNEK